MLDYNEVRERRYIVLDGEPYEVLESQVSRKQQRKPVNQTKLRNLISGGTRQHTFHYADTVEEASIDRKNIQYLFSKPNRQKNTTEYWFNDVDDKSNRFSVPDSVLGNKMQYIKEKAEVAALLFNDTIIGIDIPIKVDLEVTEAPPNIKGNTASGADKKVTLETGAVVTTPVFIEVGDVVRINTDTGSYVERV